MTRRVVGIIGGSGLCQIDGMAAATWTSVASPWGAPSDMLLFGDIGGVPTVFLPRQGRGHVHSPTTINYRANIDVLKRCGVTDVISVSAVRSFRVEMAPGDFVLVDQHIDRNVNREKSLFGSGLVDHVGFGEPTCPQLRERLADAAQTLGITVHQGGTHVAMEGRQFFTHAERLAYRNAWGAYVIGMTNMPEAKLAREAKMCYATVAMVTDHDSWHDDHGPVDIPNDRRMMDANSANARRLVETAVPLFGGDLDCPAGCNRALDPAFLTAPDRRDPALLARHDAVAGRVLAAQ